MRQKRRGNRIQINMAMVQIVTAAGEVNASIIKGLLESVGIEASYGPSGNISIVNMLISPIGSMGPNQPQNVFVEEEKAEEAMVLLREQGLVK